MNFSETENLNYVLIFLAESDLGDLLNWTVWRKLKIGFKSKRYGVGHDKEVHTINGIYIKLSDVFAIKVLEGS